MQKGTPTSDRIGDYRVLRQLSVMGSVQIHLAREEGAGGFSRNVVLKIVPNAAGGEARDTQELVADARACAKLTHPSIVRTRHVFEHDNALVLVLEYVDGISLGELLERQVSQSERPFPDDAALHIGLSICDALAHAHATLDEKRVHAPIVHRAVNPTNILIGRDGLVKLDGFGFAKILGGVATHTAKGSTWTPAYLAPEQITQQPPTLKSDVYAAGLILWELLTGQRATTLPLDPFAIEATLQAVATRKLEPLGALRPDLPRELALAVDAALVSAPESRTTSCAEMARWIRKVFHFAQGKMELRDRVQAALAAASTQQPKIPRSEPAMPSAKSVTPAPAPAIAQSSMHRTLVGLAPVLPMPTPAVDTAPAPAIGALASLPVLPSAPALPPPPVTVRATTSDVASSTPTSAPAVAVPLPVLPPLVGAFPQPRADVSPASASPWAPIASDSNESLRSSDQASGALQWSSLVGRLHAPTPWRRNTWLVAWVGLLVSLVGLIGKLTFARTTASAATRNVTTVQAPAAPAAPLPAAEPSPPPETPKEAEPLAAAAPEESAPSAPPPEEVDDSKSMKQRGLGYLIVHSTASRANVYINLRLAGALEEKLSVPCGKRFVSIGIPAGRPAKLVWLAPGKMMFVPCGGALETTMNPRALR